MPSMDAIAEGQLDFDGEFRCEEGVWVLEVGGTTTEHTFGSIRTEGPSLGLHRTRLCEPELGPLDARYITGV